MQVLGGDALHGVDEQEGDVGAVDGAHAAQDAVLLDADVDAAAAANARGIDQRDRAGRRR